MTTAAQRLLLSFLLALAVVPYLVDLDGSSIWDANEAFYVETPREMIERGDYVGPTFNYEPRFNKPVLSYWIVAGFYHLFGVSPGVQRLPIALGALGLVACAFLLARMGADGGSPMASLAPWWAAIGLAVAPRLLMFARRIFIDIYISLFMALTLVCFAAAERYPARRRLFLVLMYVAVGLGMLTKGPVAALLPGLVCLVYLLVHRELTRAREMLVPAGVLIAAAIVAPWYLLVYQRFGWTYIVSFVVGENVSRFATGLGVQVERAPWFYVPVLLTDTFPFALLVVPAAIVWWRGRGTRPGRDAGGGRIVSLLWIWILVIVGFFSLSAAKQDLYIFPVVPAVAALGGLLMARAQQGGGRAGETGAVLATLAVAGVALAAIGGGLLYLFTAAGAVYRLDGVIVVAAVGVLGGVATAGLAMSRRVFAAGVTLAAAFVLLSWVFVLRTLPSFEAYKPVPPLAAAIERAAGPDAVVVSYDQAIPSLVFYLRRHVVETGDPAALVEVLGAPRQAFAVMSERDLTELRDVLPSGICVLARRPTFDVKLKNVLARQPLPSLVLVSNRCAAGAAAVSPPSAGRGGRRGPLAAPAP